MRELLLALTVLKGVAELRKPAVASAGVRGPHPTVSGKANTMKLEAARVWGHELIAEGEV